MLFEANPEFAAQRIATAERLHWKDQEGLETFGDLVLSVGKEPGRRYPLIVVQYKTRGFLRGGTGDEYPVQIFATQGYAVLSFNRPPDTGLFGSARTIEEAERADLKEFANRRNVQSALEHGIKLIVDRGIVDPKQIGMTGLSDGASSARFALLNKQYIQSCGHEPVLLEFQYGLAARARTDALFLASRLSRRAQSRRPILEADRSDEWQNQHYRSHSSSAF